MAESEHFHNIVNRESLTRDDRWNQLVMHEGTAYIARREEDGSISVWRSVPPPTFQYMTTVRDQDEVLRFVAEDFEALYPEPKETG